jgi:hypothetical protein
MDFGVAVNDQDVTVESHFQVPKLHVVVYNDWPIQTLLEDFCKGLLVAFLALFFRQQNFGCVGVPLDFDITLFGVKDGLRLSEHIDIP